MDQTTGVMGGSPKENPNSEGTEFHKRYAAIHAYPIQGFCSEVLLSPKRIGYFMKA